MHGASQRSVNATRVARAATKRCTRTIHRTASVSQCFHKRVQAPSPLARRTEQGPPRAVHHSHTIPGAILCTSPQHIGHHSNHPHHHTQPSGERLECASLFKCEMLSTIFEFDGCDPTRRVREDLLDLTNPTGGVSFSNVRPCSRRDEDKACCGVLTGKGGRCGLCESKRVSDLDLTLGDLGLGNRLGFGGRLWYCGILGRRPAWHAFDDTILLIARIRSHCRRGRRGASEMRE